MRPINQHYLHLHHQTIDANLGSRRRLKNVNWSRHEPLLAPGVLTADTNACKLSTVRLAPNAVLFWSFAWQVNVGYSRQVLLCYLRFIPFQPSPFVPDRDRSMSGIGISSPYRRCSGQPRLSEFEFDIDGLSCRLPSGYEVGRERRPGAPRLKLGNQILGATSSLGRARRDTPTG
jgi:hypothetical protein